MRPVGALLLASGAFAASDGVAPAQAQGEFPRLVMARCATEFGQTEAECSCVRETACGDLSERQVEYVAVCIARDDAEVERMRGFMPLFERLAIFFAVQDAVGVGAPGKLVKIRRQ